MGIYIPGIEKPKGHNYVTITIWPSGAASYVLFDREGILRDFKDFKDIKVIPVPEHGRLIDADAAVEKLKRLREYHSDDSQSGVFIAHGISQCIDVLTGKRMPHHHPGKWGGRVMAALKMQLVLISFQLTFIVIAILYGGKK